MNKDLLSAIPKPEDLESSFRPSYLRDFVGQEKIKQNLAVFIKAAQTRNTALDHTLFYGPPGLGKTTLAQIIAKEMGANLKYMSGPSISKGADLAAILTNLQEKDVLFIDEVHRLNINVEEMLYSAMEDFALDIVIGEGSSARNLRINLPPFTLIGATTRLGLLSGPLRDRFGIPLRLNFYNTKELYHILVRGSKVIGIDSTEDGITEIAKRARGTPRIALRLLRRISDFAVVSGVNLVDRKIADESLTQLEIDSVGLDGNDHRYLNFIARHHQGGPVGIDTLAAALSEHKDAIEDTIEPYLMQIGMLMRTPRGRMITHATFEYLGIQKPKPPEQTSQDLDNSLQLRIFEQ